MVAATLVNHTEASALGQWLLPVLTPSAMRWALALSFIAMGVWVLVPGKLLMEAVQPARTKLGIFGTTLLTFFSQKWAIRPKSQPWRWPPGSTICPVSLSAPR